MALQIVNGKAATRTAGANGSMILTLPFGSMRSLADAARALEARGPRRFPIDAAKVIGPVAGLSELTLALPHGWHAQLPPPVEVKGKWGSYVSRFSQQGDTLHFTRRMEGARGVYPPESLPELTGWFRAVAKDDVPYLVLEPGATP